MFDAAIALWKAVVLCKALPRMEVSLLPSTDRKETIAVTCCTKRAKTALVLNSSVQGICVAKNGSALTCAALLPLLLMLLLRATTIAMTQPYSTRVEQG